MHKFWQEHISDEDSYPFTKRSLDKLFVMCHNQAARDTGLAYQHPAGEYSIWVRGVDGNKEAHVLFNVNLEDGGDYGFKHQIYKNHKQVNIWMVDNKTNQSVTEVYSVKLKNKNKLTAREYDGIWATRCKNGTV